MSRLARFRTLVLDTAFRPLKAIRWQRAVVLDLSRRVEVLEYYEAEVRTTSKSFPLPAVVRIPTYFGLFPFKVALSRKNVLARDHHRCQYCGEQPPIRELTLDHVLPRSRGGPSSWDNLVTACGPCNHRKGDQTPDEAGMVLMSKPARPRVPPDDRRGFSGEVPTEWRLYLPI